jgi:hypothetical protein
MALCPTFITHEPEESRTDAMNTEDFRKAIDADDGLKSKRRTLFLLSLLLLAIVVSGANIKEASSLIFKIEFTNHENLQWLLIAGIFYSALRYYAYSEIYRDELFNQWSKKLISDPTVYRYDQHKEEVGGLLEKAVDVWGGDEPGLAEPEYRRIRLLKRVIAYSATEEDAMDGPIYFKKYIDLNKYDSRWKRKDFLLLLWIELKYRANAWVAHRETLDLVAPYLLAVAALAAFFYKKFS